jgi:hypothetical protein
VGPNSQYRSILGPYQYCPILKFVRDCSGLVTFITRANCLFWVYLKFLKIKTLYEDGFGVDSIFLSVDSFDLQGLILIRSLSSEFKASYRF